MTLVLSLFHLHTSSSSLLFIPSKKTLVSRLSRKLFSSSVLGSGRIALNFAQVSVFSFRLSVDVFRVMYCLFVVTSVVHLSVVMWKKTFEMWSGLIKTGNGPHYYHYGIHFRRYNTVLGLMVKKKPLWRTFLIMFEHWYKYIWMAQWCSDLSLFLNLYSIALIL